MPIISSLPYVFILTKSFSDNSGNKYEIKYSCADRSINISDASETITVDKEDIQWLINSLHDIKALIDYENKLKTKQIEPGN
jgi:predicted acetyltransferase